MEEVRRELGVTEEEFHVLGTPEGRRHIEKMIAGLKTPVVAIPEPNVYLRQLYAGEKIVLDPTDGTETIARTKDLFLWGIDADFKKGDLDAPAGATGVMDVGVHEMILDGTFGDIYGSLGRPLAELCLTQAQIIGFCMKHQDKLRQDGYGTFFLFEAHGEFFLVSVYVNSGGRLYASVSRFSNGRVWSAGCHRRFVLPQLGSLDT